MLFVIYTPVRFSPHLASAVAVAALHTRRHISAFWNVTLPRFTMGMICPATGARRVAGVDWLCYDRVVYQATLSGHGPGRDR